MVQNAVNGALSYQVWDSSNFLLNLRFSDSFLNKTKKYPIYRDLRFAARIDLEALLDELALDDNNQPLRIDSKSLIIESDGALILCRGSLKKEYCSCYFSIWGKSVDDVEKIKKNILTKVDENIIHEPMFSINWHFLTSKNEMESVNIEELANDVLLNEAYPDFNEGLIEFIDSYIRSKEAVLVLQGPPGTGKTRLIRAILGRMSLHKGSNASAVYTGDKKTMESDEIFVRFITGWEDAFVVEDADHMLKPRSEGNDNLHRFLTIADGVIRSQGRKIIFSTNLPNVGDIDDALIRPGRCFARVSVRLLDLTEAMNLVTSLLKGQDATSYNDWLKRSGKKHFSLADIYKAIAV